MRAPAHLVHLDPSNAQVEKVYLAPPPPPYSDRCARACPAGPPWPPSALRKKLSSGLSTASEEKIGLVNFRTGKKVKQYDGTYRRYLGTY